MSQPFPVPFKKGMVPSSKRAVHSTRVLPQLMSTEPPLVSVKSRIMVMGLNSFSCLPSLRMIIYPPNRFSFANYCITYPQKGNAKAKSPSNFLQLYVES